MIVKYVYILISILAVFGISVSNGSKAIAGEPDISTPTICAIVDTVIGFRFAQEEAADICGIDQGTGDKLCLRKPSQSLIVMREALRLRPSTIDRGPLSLFGVTKLNQVEKDEFKGLYNAITIQSQILESVKIWHEFDKFPWTKIYAAESSKMGRENGFDLVLAYFEADKARYSRKPGPTDPKVFELEEQIKARKEVWARQASKTNAELKMEVSLGHQKMFDFLAAKAKPKAEIAHQVFLAKRAFETGNWYSTDNPVDCSGRISPRKDMYFMRSPDLVNSATGNVLPKNLTSYHWHPKTFNPTNVMVFGGGRYALLAENGRDGSHVLELGKPPRIMLLQQVGQNWQVIATTSERAVFY